MIICFQCQEWVFTSIDDLISGFFGNKFSMTIHSTSMSCNADCPLLVGHSRPTTVLPFWCTVCNCTACSTVPFPHCVSGLARCSETAQLSGPLATSLKKPKFKCTVIFSLLFYFEIHVKPGIIIWKPNCYLSLVASSHPFCSAPWHHWGRDKVKSPYFCLWRATLNIEQGQGPVFQKCKREATNWLPQLFVTGLVALTKMVMLMRRRRMMKHKQSDNPDELHLFPHAL